MGNKLSDHFDNLSEDSKDVLKNSIEYYKLDLFKKFALSLVSGGQFILKIGILVLILFFISLGLAFLIGNKLGSVAYGFFVVGGAYIIILILISVLGKKLLEKPVFAFINKILHADNDLERELNEELKNTEPPE